MNSPDLNRIAVEALDTPVGMDVLEAMKTVYKLQGLFHKKMTGVVPVQPDDVFAELDSLPGNTRVEKLKAATKIIAQSRNADSQQPGGDGRRDTTVDVINALTTLIATRYPTSTPRQIARMLIEAEPDFQDLKIAISAIDAPCDLQGVEREILFWWILTASNKLGTQYGLTDEEQDALYAAIQRNLLPENDES